MAEMISRLSPPVWRAPPWTSSSDPTLSCQCIRFDPEERECLLCQDEFKSYNIKHSEGFSDLLFLVLVTDLLLHHLEELNEVQCPGPVLVSICDHLLKTGDQLTAVYHTNLLPATDCIVIPQFTAPHLNLRLGRIVSDVPEYLPEILPIDVPVLVRVELAEGAGEPLDLTGRECLVSVHVWGERSGRMAGSDWGKGEGTAREGKERRVQAGYF